MVGVSGACEGVRGCPAVLGPSGGDMNHGLGDSDTNHLGLGGSDVSHLCSGAEVGVTLCNYSTSQPHGPRGFSPGLTSRATSSAGT